MRHSLIRVKPCSYHKNNSPQSQSHTPTYMMRFLCVLAATTRQLKATEHQGREGRKEGKRMKGNGENAAKLKFTFKIMLLLRG